MITKDTSNNADFIFGIDMNKLFTDNSAYSNLIEGMTDTAKMQIAANSKIMAFNITRHRVKRDLSLSCLGSPLIPYVFSDETVIYSVIDSMKSLRGIPISVSGQPSGMRYLTASDNDLSNQTAGTYQYELYISFVDGFSPTMDALLKRLYAASSSISKYLAMLNIPRNYNSETDKVATGMRDSDIQKISKAYVDALSYFNKLKNTSNAQRRAATLIAFPVASKESIGTFQTRLNAIISKVEEVAFQTGTSVSPSSVANKSANSNSTSPPIVEINHSFNNTISVECRDNRYIDYFNGVNSINRGAGINTYLYGKVKNSTPETTYLEAPMSLLEMFAHRGVTFKETPLTIDSDNAARGLGVDTESFNGNDVETYIGKSASAVGGLLRDDLSPLDLSTETLETDVSTLGVGAVSAGMSSKLAGSPSQRGGKQGNLNRRQEPDAEIGRTMVLTGINLSDSSVPMPMSLEWKPLEEVVAPTSGAIALCMQDAGSAEVINRFFLMRAK
tara:strand:- start:88 stop:1593 length:1506 start_codon:yes stop_codon:yes gene_type:complete